MAAVIMVLLSLLCHIAPAAMIRAFNDDPAVVAEGSEYLAIVSWTFVASGLIFVSSSVFQGLGNTLPALASSGMRLVLFAVPAFWLSRQPGFALKQIWYLSAASVVLQMVVTISLLMREFNRRLAPSATSA
jgi:Na+-driven multidrug efflux pump